MPLSHLWHEYLICVTCLIHICDMTHSYLWIDQCMTWCTQTQLHYHSWMHTTHLHTRRTTHLYFWHDSFILVTWLTHICDMTHADTSKLAQLSAHDSSAPVSACSVCDPSGYSCTSGACVLKCVAVVAMRCSVCGPPKYLCSSCVCVS